MRIAGKSLAVLHRAGKHGNLPVPATRSSRLPAPVGCAALRSLYGGVMDMDMGMEKAASGGVRGMVALAGALALSACGGSVIPPPASAGFTPAAPRPGQSPQQAQPTHGVIGVDARALVRLFGEPRLDIRDPAVRKLQFGNGSCVLDTYLYPPRARREPVVTFAEARAPGGETMDWADCAARLRDR